MKQHNIIFKILLAGLFLPASLLSIAQTSSSSYFLDGSFTRYKLNPAMTPERGFFAFPMLSNYNFDIYTNVGVSNFLFDSKSDPNKLTTFMSSEVDKNQFLNALPSTTKLNVGFDIDILAFGFSGFNGFNTVNLKLHTSENINLPKSLFSFMKAGLADGDYLIEDINVNSMTYAELSLGHSHKIGENLTIGANLKYLFGGNYVDANIDRLYAKVSNQGWQVNTDATIKAGVDGTSFKYKDGTRNEIDDLDFDFDGIGGNGFAIDLGAVYDMKDFVEGLTLSASLTDLGFIHWSDMSIAQTDNKENVFFTGFKDYDVTNDDSEDDTFDDLGDDLENMVKIYDKGKKSESVFLNSTFRIGAEYIIPYVDWVSVGELITIHTGTNKTFESRTSLNLSPCGWFDMSGNFALSPDATGLGFMINFHPVGFNLFIASDYMKATLNSQFVPDKDESCASVSFGIIFPVGGKNN